MSIRNTAKLPFVAECCSCNWFLADPKICGQKETTQEALALRFATAREAEAAAIDSGWQVRGTEALCPDCVKELERELTA